MEQVHIVMKRRTVEYEGSEMVIISVHKDHFDARATIRDLENKNNDCHTEYYYDTYNVI